MERMHNAHSVERKMTLSLDEGHDNNKANMMMVFFMMVVVVVVMVMVMVFIFNVHFTLYIYEFVMPTENI